MVISCSILYPPGTPVQAGRRGQTERGITLEQAQQSTRSSTSRALTFSSDTFYPTGGEEDGEEEGTASTGESRHG